MRPLGQRWQIVFFAVAVIALGVSAGTSFISASGTVTVQTIWQHNPISWTQLTCSGTCPAAEAGAAMADDPGDGFVVLQDTSGDTWTYLDSVWTSLGSLTGAPGAQKGGMMIFAPTPGGGTGDGGQILYKSALGTTASDFAFLFDKSYTGTATWADIYCNTRTNPDCYLGQVPGANVMYDPVGVTGDTFGGMIVFTTVRGSWITEPGFAPVEWSSTTGPATGMSGASMAWDSHDGYGVFFDTSGNTWKLTPGGGWTEIIPVSSCTPTTCPSPRSGAVMVYYGACGEIILYGGTTNGAGSGALSDTWKFTGGSWQELNPVTSPPARYDATGTYDSEDGYILIFGGYSSSGTALSDWWSLSPSISGCP